MDDLTPVLIGFGVVGIIGLCIWSSIEDGKKFNAYNNQLYADCISAGHSQYDCEKDKDARRAAREHDQAIETSAAIVAGSMGYAAGSRR